MRAIKGQGTATRSTPARCAQRPMTSNVGSDVTIFSVRPTKASTAAFKSSLTPQPSTTWSGLTPWRPAILARRTSDSTSGYRKAACAAASCIAAIVLREGP